MAAAEQPVPPARERGEQQLIQHAMKGDGEAFRLLMDRYIRHAYNIAYRFTGDHDSAEDVTQEAFVKVHAALPSPTDGVLAFSYTSCPTIFGAHHVRPELECAAFNEWVRTQLEALPASVPVIVVNRSSAYLFGRSHLPGAEAKPPSIFFDRAPPTVPDAAWLHEYEKRLVASACALARGRTVYLVRPLPEMTVDVPRAVARKLLLGKPLDIGISLDDYSRRHAFIRAAQDKAVNTCGVRVLDPLPWLCTDGWCSATEAGRPRYYDDNHLSEFGNRPLIPMFKAQLRPL